MSISEWVRMGEHRAGYGSTAGYVEWNGSKDSDTSNVRVKKTHNITLPLQAYSHVGKVILYYFPVVLRSSWKIR